MRVLVTGAAGFLGSHITDRLLDEGHTVVGIDNLSTGRIENFPRHRAILLEADISEEDTWVGHQALDLTKFDVIYHCAASYRDRNAWEEDARTNVLGTINVVRRALEDGARLIYLQTALCYGTKQGDLPLPTDAPIDPHGSYAVSKTAGERYIMDAVDPNGQSLEWVSLRLANIYGPRNLSGPIPTFYQRLKAGKPCTLVDSRRDFVFVEDFLRVALLAGAGAGRGLYHVATGRDYAIPDIFQSLVKAMHIDIEQPPVLPRGSDDAPSILLDPIDTYYDFGGWTARTPLVTGLRKTVDWYDLNPPSETYTHLAMPSEKGTK